MRAKASFTDHTYYAQWGLAANVKWHNNYGDGGCNKDDRCQSNYVEEKKGGGGSASVKTPTAGRAGYVLKGWSRDPDATEAEYLPGGYDVSVTADTEFYAVWEKVDYSVTFRSAPLAAESEPLPEKMTGLSYGDSFELPRPNLLRRREAFKGWLLRRSNSLGGDVHWYTWSSNWTFTVSDNNGEPSVGLEAIWYDAPQVEIKYEYIDTSYKTFTTQTFYRDGLDDPQTVPGSPMSKTGLVFKGWTAGGVHSTHVDFEPGKILNFHSLETQPATSCTRCTITRRGRSSLPKAVPA